MTIGLAAIIIVPNLGDARFRVPLTNTRIPVLIGGTRFPATRDPRVPNLIAIATLVAALLAGTLALLDPPGSGAIGSTLEVDPFSSLMTNLFLLVLILCTVSATQRLPSDPEATAPAEDEDEEGESAKTSALYDNRRQADFHILLLTLGLGMSLMAKSTHLFMLFVCLELASLSSYVLVGFHKETKAGGEAGTKYFIVGSVASAIVAGVLATASKAMGFVALMRLLLTIAMPATGPAFWYGALAVISVVTMTWGNLAALSSDNPKPVLAYSSVAHAGYMLAAVSAIGSGLADGPASEMIVVAVLFHLCVLVLFKMGPFMVLSAIEREGGSHRVAGLNGLASRDPLMAASMFVFMLSLAGVPPFSGFLSKLLMLNGIVTVSAGTGGAGSILSWATSVEPVFWLAVAIVLNSALSIFYYLRMGMVMFFEPNEGEEGSPCNPVIRTLIVSLAVLSLAFGIGPPSEWLLGLAEDAAAALLA